MAEETRPKPSVVRVRQAPKVVDDLRTGGGVRKMFRDAKDRLEHLAVTYPSAVDEFKSIYPSTGETMPYLVLELVPSAIAKAHSASQILESCGLHLLGARRLEERVIHGSERDCRNLATVLMRAADLAPTNRELDEWSETEKKRKQEAEEKSKKTGKKHRAEPVRRSLRSRDLSWNAVAQLSTISGVRVVRPDEKVTAPSEFKTEELPTLIATFPFVVRQGGASGDDLGSWASSLEAIAKSMDLGPLRVLRGPKTALEDLTRIVGRSKLWNVDRARPHRFLGGQSFIVLVNTRTVEALRALAALPFVLTVESIDLAGTATSDAGGIQVPPPPVSKEKLPVVGLVDTGISIPSPLEPYVLHRRGIDTIRQQGVNHAADVAYLLVHNGQSTPWRQSQELPCALIDVARIARGTTEAEVDAAVTEATLDADNSGTVNLSANARGATRSVLAPHVSSLGALLDQKCLESADLTIVNSAGNSGCVGMDPPADAVHVISVGAVTRRPDGAYSRSDFSCYGGGIAHNVKPTLVVPAHDGNGHDPTWTTVCPSNNKGTSVAAPVVSRLHANLIKRNFSRDEALILMVHNAVHPGRDIFHRPSTRELEEFGFGVVPTLEMCDPPDRARFTLLYEVEALRRKIMTLDLPVPASLASYKAFVRLSAYTRAPVNRDAGEEYVAAEVPTRLRLHRRKGTTPHVDLPPEPEDFGDRYERHRVEYGWKWAVLRRYSERISLGDYSRFSLRIGPVIWRDWAQREFKKEEEGAGVKVQCALTFFPLQKDAPAFFDAFYSAFARQNISMELPAQVQLEIE